jgi:sulfite reductase (NADPH) hemoprotein beta-component
MYSYDQFDKQMVRERVTQFRDQVSRRLTGALTEEEFRPLRLMNGVYLQLHAYMLRAAIPYGTLNSAQMNQLAHIADKFDKGYGHFTTRQNIQYNWVQLKDMADILDLLADVEMHAIQTSGNCIRNVTADHFAGVAHDEVEDPRITAEFLRQWSTFHPEFSFLPRKFKIAVTGAKADRAVIMAHDIGLQIVNQNGEIGYKVIVGGGLGRTPMIGQVVREFLPKNELLPFTEAVMRVYNAEGRRDNKYKARIKILVHETGIGEITRRIEEEYAALDKKAYVYDSQEFARIATHFALPPLENLPQKTLTYKNAALKRFVEVNSFSHKQAGYVALTISLKPQGGIPGDATAEQMRVVAELAKTYSHDEIRVSHNQNLILPHVKQDDVEAIYAILEKHGLATANINLITDIIACPGMDYCSLATARSIPIAQSISNHFSAKQEADIGELNINISGCINACGHHHVAHIGILGLEKSGQESYQITLGGDSSENAAIGKLLGPGLAAEQLPSFIERLVDIYKGEKQGEERFLDTYKRIGAAPFKKAYDHVN